MKYRTLVLEAYIIYAHFIEDSAFPTAPAPPSSNLENKKARCVVVTVRRNGRVLINKARENANGTFSIGRTWKLEDLSAIQVYNTIVPSTTLELQQKEWASDEGVAINPEKPY